MSDLVSRQAVKEYICGLYDDQLGFVKLKDIIEHLDYVPSVELVRESKEGDSN